MKFKYREIINKQAQISRISVTTPSQLQLCLFNCIIGLSWATERLAAGHICSSVWGLETPVLDDSDPSFLLIISSFTCLCHLIHPFLPSKLKLKLHCIICCIIFLPNDVIIFAVAESTNKMWPEPQSHSDPPVS